MQDRLPGPAGRPAEEAAPAAEEAKAEAPAEEKPAEAAPAAEEKPSEALPGLRRRRARPAGLRRRRRRAAHKTIAHDPTRLIETANAPILGIDVHGNITEWNSKASTPTGFTEAEYIDFI